jgi:diacylglycerol kinase family enzyme
MPSLSTAAITPNPVYGAIPPATYGVAEGQQDGRGRSTFLAINVRSRRGGGDMCQAVTEAFRNAGVAVRRCQYENASDLPGLIHGAAGQVDRVVIGGGNGTLNATLPGLLATGLLSA